MILTHWHPDHIGGVGTCTASVGGVMKSAEVNNAHQNKRICLQMVSHYVQMLLTATNALNIHVNFQTLTTLERCMHI